MAMNDSHPRGFIKGKQSKLKGCEDDFFHLVWPSTVAEQDLELRVGGGGHLLALMAFLPSIISSFFTQNKGARAPPLMSSNAG